MALSEDQVAERAKRRREGDINYLTSIVGVFDTQGRDTNFSSLESTHPNLSFGPVPDVAEVPSASPVRWLNEEGEWPDEPQGAVEGSGEAEPVDAEPAQEPTPAADAPAEDAVAVESEGAAPEPAAASASVPAPESVNVPDNWETFEVGPLRALATSMGLPVAPTMNKMGLRKLIQGALDPD
jgi:hypothetical protein